MIFYKPFRITLAILAGLLFLTSCEPEGENVNFTAEEMVGTYNCAEKSQVYSSSNYEVIVSKSAASSSQITVENFYQLGISASVKVNINGSDLIIPKQVVNNITISGDGVIISKSRMNLNYTADDGGGVVDVVSGGLSK
ncbi:MAG: hypothetical protein H0V01_07020 [Bacteroidetes bacterium]|nr:hypothetical protein [Bacteroidota bacterium]HET6246002.1 hypothetical protein [Bacteroidia bacterium]